MAWFSGSATSTMPVTFGSDRPLLPWQRKFVIFNTKSAITKLVQLIPQMPAPTRGFSGSTDLMVSVKLCPDDPCCHGNENLEILIKNLEILISQSTNLLILLSLIIYYQFNRKFGIARLV